MSVSQTSSVSDEIYSQQNTGESSIQSSTSPQITNPLSGNVGLPHTIPQTSSFANTPSSQGGSINSIMNFIYPNYQSPINTGSESNTPTGTISATMNLSSEEAPSTNLSVAAAISGASATLASNDEPELKKVKLTHFSFYKNPLFADNTNPEAHNMVGFGSNLRQGSAQNLYSNHKKLEDRIGNILCCTVCLDLPLTAIYQCTNGHLMCAGCFSHLLADARLKDEQPTCPNCRCEISKSSCSRNLAVEKTLSELPANCMYCNVMFPRNCLDQHQRKECLERLEKCSFSNIGCTWEGPFHELSVHTDNCTFPNRPCREIIGFLKKKEVAHQEEQQALMTLVGMLSYEKICFNDLQFKQYRTDEITPKLYFETNRFSAFFHQWVLKARVNDNQKNPNLSLNRYISFQLMLKSRLSSSHSNLEIKFCILKGPFGEVPISPSVHTFDFNQNKLETDYIKLEIKSDDCNKLLSSKTINFRCFMFQC